MKRTWSTEREEELSAPARRRRQFVACLAAAVLLAGQRPLMATPERGAPEAITDNELRVAATQMTPQRGAVDANVVQAEQLVREGAAKDAALIVLPEMFTSAAAFHQNMVKAIRPLDGAPAQLLEDMARKENAIVGGSFLAEDAGRVYNAFSPRDAGWHDPAP